MDWFKVLCKANFSHVAANGQPSSFDPNDDLLRALTTFCDHLHNGTHWTPCESLRSFHLVAFAKPDHTEEAPDIRPIAIGESLVRLAARAAMIKVAPEAAEALYHNGQVAVGVKRGTEVMTKFVSITRDLGYLWRFFDMKNAFGSLNREVIPEALRECGLEASMSHFDAAYGTASKIIWSSVHGFLSNRALDQGDGMGPLYYAAGSIKLAKALHAEFGAEGLVIAAFSDDVGCAVKWDVGDADAEDLLYRASLRYAELALEIGLELNKKEKKSPLLLPPGRSIDELTLDWIAIGSTPNEEGCKILGCPMGTPEYVATSLDKVVASMKEQAEQYDILSRQDALILFRYCLAPRPTFLLRALPASSTKKFAEDASDVLRGALAKIAGVRELSVADYQAAALPFSLGGLGFHCPKMTRVPASLGCMQQLLYRDAAAAAERWKKPVIWDFTSRSSGLSDKFAELRDFIDGDNDTTLEDFLCPPVLQPCHDITDFLETWENAATPVADRETVDRTTAGLPDVLGRTGASITAKLSCPGSTKEQNAQAALTMAAEQWLYKQSLIDAENKHERLLRHTAKVANDAVFRALPTYECEMSDFQIQVALSLRYGWALPNVLPLRHRCGHKRHTDLQTMWHSLKCTKYADVAIKARHELLVKAIKKACSKLNIWARETGAEPPAADSLRCPFDLELDLPDGRTLALDVTVTTPFEPEDSVTRQTNAVLANVHNLDKAEEARQDHHFQNTAANKEHQKRILRTDIPPTLNANGRHPIWVTKPNGRRECTNALTAPELATQQCKSFSTFTLESCLVFGKDARKLVDTLTKIAEEDPEAEPQSFKEGFLREIGVAMAKGNARCVRAAMGNTKRAPVDWHGRDAARFDAQPFAPHEEFWDAEG